MEIGNKDMEVGIYMDLTKIITGFLDVTLTITQVKFIILNGI